MNDSNASTGISRFQMLLWVAIASMIGATFGSGLIRANDAEAQGVPAALFKIGYVDVVLAATQSRQIQARVTAAEEAIKIKQEELETIMNDYTAKQNELQARRSTITADEIRKMEDVITETGQKINNFQYEISTMMKRMENDVTRPAVDQILNASQAIAKREQFGLILSSEVIVYGEDLLDITPLVVAELDKD